MPTRMDNLPSATRTVLLLLLHIAPKRECIIGCVFFYCSIYYLVMFCGCPDVGSPVSHTVVQINCGDIMAIVIGCVFHKSEDARVWCSRMNTGYWQLGKDDIVSLSPVPVQPLYLLSTNVLYDAVVYRTEPYAQHYLIVLGPELVSFKNNGFTGLGSFLFSCGLLDPS